MSWRRLRARATLARTRRPATGRLNSGVRRQKTLFQLPWLSCSTAPLIAAPLLPSTTTLNVLSRQTLLRKVCGARSNIACVVLAGFGNGVWCRSVYLLLMPSFLTGPAESLRVRVQAFPLRFSEASVGFMFHRHPSAT
jgi:hypothetical protein